MRLRSQLPGYSPLSAGALARSLIGGLPGGRHPVDAVRELLAERFGGTPVLLSSGTHALQTALELATGAPDLADGPVALPAYSCFDLLTAAVGSGVRVDFYDIDPSTLTPDLDSLDQVLSRGARVVVAGNLYGRPLDWDAIRSRVESVGGLLIEDAAQGLGSTWMGRTGGTFGDATVLSFGRGKGWTGGGGGALLLRDTRLTAGAQGSALRPAGSIRPWLGSLAQWVLGRPSIYGLPRSLPFLSLGETVYKEPTPPEALSNRSAILISATRKAAEDELEARRRWADVWDRKLPEGPWISVRELPAGTGAYLRYPVVTASASIRHRLLARLDRFGAASGYPRILPDLPEAREIGALPPQRDLKGARALVSTLFTLPTHSRVAERDVSEAILAFQAVREECPTPGQDV